MAALPSAANLLLRSLGGLRLSTSSCRCGVSALAPDTSSRSISSGPSEAAESAAPAPSSTPAPPPPTHSSFEALVADKAAYQRVLDDARHSIFGTHIGNGLRSGRKVLRKALVAERMADWYLPILTKFDPIFSDPRDEQKRQKLAALKRRGKGPPPKGQGKRAKKKG